MNDSPEIDCPPGGYFSGRVRSFRYAACGLRELVATQPNFRIHLLAMLLVIAAGLGLGVGRLEWVCLVFAIAGVLVTESLNTAIEAFVDAQCVERKESARICKDVAAAAVLLASLAAALTGVLILGPPILKILFAMSA